MSQRDQASILHFVPLFTPVAARTDNTPIVSAIIDTKGYNALTMALILGANTDANATFSVLIEDGNAANLSDAAPVADEDLIGTEALAGFTAADDDGKCRKIGYVGNKRYARMTVTPAGNDSGNIFLAGVAILGEPASAPTPTPPQ